MEKKSFHSKKMTGLYICRPLVMKILFRFPIITLIRMGPKIIPLGLN